MAIKFLSGLARVFSLQEYKNKPLQIEGPQQVTIHVDAVGSSGTENYAGYYSEEYLQSLRGTQAADLWDKMRRSDPKIKMVLSAVKNPIKSAQWRIEPSDDSEEAKQKAALIEHILFKDSGQPWTQTLSEMLTCVDFGFSLFEVTHKPVIGHQVFGNYTGIKKIGFRSQRTIERWNLDELSGDLVSVSQYAYGDLQRLVDIESQYLLIFTIDKEGDNFEGVSMLRPCYGPWKRKNDFLRLLAIGTEKNAVPPPVAKCPEGKENSTQFTNAKKVLEKYVSHEQQYIILPSGWEIEFPQSGFDPEKLRISINHENVEIVHAFLANFLELGQSGSGSYALSYDLSDFFLTGIEQIAKLICEEINRKLIPEICKLNHGESPEYPKLCFSGIRDKAGKELAEVLKLLIDGKVVIPDDSLENLMREKYGFGKKSEDGQREVQTQPQPGAFGFSEKRKKLFLAEKPKTARGLIKQATEELQPFMQENVEKIMRQMKDDAVSKYKRANPSQYGSIYRQVEPRGVSAYKAELQDLLAVIASQSLDMVRKEVPKAKDVKLSENVFYMSEFDKLPTNLKKKVKELANIITEAQMLDVEKQMKFVIQSSMTSTDSLRQVEADLDAAIGKYSMGPAIAAGAANGAAQTINYARMEFFLDEDVRKEVEAFVFVNPDPVTPICQDLVGTVFSLDDPNIDRYSPPLHHNCKSFLSPILKGKDVVTESLEPGKGKTGLTKEELDKYITLAESGSMCIQTIDISKKKAFSIEEARRFAMEYADTFIGIDENETHYRFRLLDPSLYLEGTLKTFEPMEGVVITWGKVKPIALAEIKTPRSGNLQTVIVSKANAKSVEEAKKIAKEFGAQHMQVDETEDSYRFRQRNPGDFVEGTFLSKKIDAAGVTLVYGKLR